MAPDRLHPLCAQVQSETASANTEDDDDDDEEDDEDDDDDEENLEEQVRSPIKSVFPDVSTWQAGKCPCVLSLDEHRMFLLL